MLYGSTMIGRVASRKGGEFYTIVKTMVDGRKRIKNESEMDFFIDLIVVIRSSVKAINNYVDYYYYYSLIILHMYVPCKYYVGSS